MLSLKSACCLLANFCVAFAGYGYGPWGMLRNNESRVIMDFTPKAACTVAVEIFLNEMGIKYGQNYTDFVHNYREQSFYKYAGIVSKAELYSRDWYKFKVVRNPWDRAVSSFIHVMKYYRKDYFGHKFKAERGRHGHGNVTFEDFLEIALESQISGRSLKAGGHAELQVRDLEWKAWLNGVDIYDKIVHAEEFSKELEEVNSETQRTHFTVLPDYSKHFIIKNEAYNGSYCGNQTWRNLLNQTGGIPSYENFYNEKTINLVRKAFYKDIVVYGYNFPF
mmetsp:Transcript_4795/g.7870  ORF Transcript_4795/g.7870 Transcript_4795/m.7870 type:complete len:278 (-) Transcript_4795:109-942(-)